jgi:eukaryotic-like serine/threonine-protein kinase
LFSPGNLIAGRYRLIRQIGRGGMGTVWSARNEAILRDVAIKVMRPDVTEKEPTALTRFFNEARICGSIRHPGIVDVIDLGQAEDGSSFIVMELLDGESLESVLLRQKKLTPLQILPVIADVARSIDLAHARGVVHRDLKPANIFLHQLATGETVTKVLDFGISKAMYAGPFYATQTGSVIGSPAYMSPEQARNSSDTDHRTDIFALGIILYQSLSGRFPFDISNYNTLIADILTRPAPPLDREVPRALAEAVLRCLEKDPAKRFAGASELAAKLDEIAGDLGGFRASSIALSRISIPRPGGSGPLREVAATYAAGALETAAALSQTMSRSQRSKVWLWAAGSFLAACAVAGALVLAGVVTKKPASELGAQAPVAGTPLPVGVEPSQPGATARPPAASGTSAAPAEPTGNAPTVEPAGTAGPAPPAKTAGAAPTKTGPGLGQPGPVSAPPLVPPVKTEKRGAWDYD